MIEIKESFSSDAVVVCLFVLTVSHYIALAGLEFYVGQAPARRDLFAIAS